MKVLLVVWAVVSTACGGSVSWPGATVVTHPPTPLRTFLPGYNRGFGLSTAQYINAVPTGFHLAYQPQVSYHVPQLSPIAPGQHTFLPVPGAAYYPSNVFYPTYPGLFPAPVGPLPPGTPILPAPPVVPGQPPAPSQDQPNDPSQAAGDADTAVVDSADFPQQNNEQSPPTETPQPEQPSSSNPPASQPEAPSPPPMSPAAPAPPSYPSLPQLPPLGGIPAFPSLPQYPQPIAPSFPQIPQEIGQNPQFPSFPQFPQGGEVPFPGLPQFPQIPSFPQFPQVPSNPNIPQSPSPSPPPSFPGADLGGDKGINDEDTVSVESA